MGTYSSCDPTNTFFDLKSFLFYCIIDLHLQFFFFFIYIYTKARLNFALQIPFILLLYENISIVTVSHDLIWE